MRVLHVTPHPELRNGIAEYARTFARVMRECAGVEMRQMAFREGEQSRRAIVRELDRLDLAEFDVIHGEVGAGLNSVFYAMARLARRAPGSTLVTLHDPPTFLFSPTLHLFRYRTRGVLNKVARKLVADPLYNVARLPVEARRIGRYVVLNRGAVEALRRRVPGVEVHYVPLVGTGRTRVTTGALTDVLCYGYLARVKGIELALAAVSLLRARGVRLRLHVVGGTLDERYERELRADAKRLGVHGDVVWHGYVPDEDLDRVLDASGAAVLPYRGAEPLGASAAVVRLMEHGLPVVLSDIPRFSAEYAAGGDVLVFRDGDAAALAERLEALVTDDALRAGLATASHRRVTTVHAPAAVAARFLKLYEATAAGSVGT